MLNERGLSMSTLTACLLPAFVLIAGLAIDGAAQVAGNRKAEAVAASAARAGMDAAAASRVQGETGEYYAINAAKNYVGAHSDLKAEIGIANDGELKVKTAGQTKTLFLSIVGVNALDCKGEASVDLFAS